MVATSVRPRVPRRLVVHALLLSVLLGVGASWMRLEVPWVGDEGSYALQVRSLQQGGWEYDYAGRVIDNRGSWFPLMATGGYPTASGKRYFAYLKHPAYPWAQYQLTRIFGDHVALYLLPLAGTLFAAIAAWFLMAEINPRWSATAFWLTASSPLLVNAYVMWAHAPSAALAGFLALAAVRIGRYGPRLPSLALFLFTLVPGILLRSEIQLFGAAIVLGLAWLIIRRDGASFLARVIPLGALSIPLILILFTRKMEFWIIERIIGAGVAEDGIRQGSANASSYWPGRISGAWHLLFEGSASGSRSDSLLYLALASTVMSGILLRIRFRMSAFVFIASATIALIAVWIRFDEQPLEAAGGLFVAWPILAIGVLATRMKETSQIEQALWVAITAFLAMILATQYDIAGGLEWGARFLSPLLPLVAVLMASGFHRCLDSRPPIDKAIMVPALCVLALGPTLAGVRVLQHHREVKAPLIDAIAATRTRLIVLTTPLLNELPREAWRLSLDVGWIVAPHGDADIVLRRLHDAGFAEVGIIQDRASSWAQDSPYQSVTDLTFPMLAGAGVEMLRLESHAQEPSG